jgi:TRAP-type C4-dicarboxylate transport system substrate-binding protein
MNYMTALPLAHSTGAVLISSKYLKKLPQDLSRLLASTFDKAMADLTSALREQNREAIQMIRDSGLTIIPIPSGVALEEFYVIHSQVARKLTGKIYPREVLERVYRILKRPH